MKKEIKAEIWVLQVYNSVLDKVHNNYTIIKELYIPSEKISCNLANDSLHCFPIESGLHRYTYKTCKAKKISTIIISKEFIENVKNFIDSKKKIMNDLNSFLTCNQ